MLCLVFVEVRTTGVCEEGEQSNAVGCERLLESMTDEGRAAVAAVVVMAVGLGVLGPDDPAVDQPSVEEILEYHQQLVESRDDIGYEIDGVVIKLDDLPARELMGATNPKQAEPGTIRADFADSVDANAVHGSDSPASAER